MWCLSRVFGILLAFSSLLTVPETGECQVIFVDPCGMEIPQGRIGILRVWVCLEGPIRDGISGARFRISGLPAEWITDVSPSPPAFVDGDAFGSGIYVGGSPCLTSPTQYLELFTVAIFAPTEETDVLLSATAIDPPLSPPFDCPFVYLCDAPAFTKVCCRGDGARINVRDGPGCPLAVESRAWTEVKSLFRN